MWKKPHNWLIAAAALLVIVLLGLNVCTAVNPETGMHYAVAFKDRLIYILFIVLSFIISDVTLLSAKQPFYQVFLAIVNAIVLLGFQIWIFVEFFTTNDRESLAAAIGHILQSPASTRPLYDREYAPEALVTALDHIIQQL